MPVRHAFLFLASYSLLNKQLSDSIQLQNTRATQPVKIFVSFFLASNISHLTNELYIVSDTTRRLIRKPNHSLIRIHLHLARKRQIRHSYCLHNGRRSRELGREFQRSRRRQLRQLNLSPLWSQRLIEWCHPRNRHIPRHPHILDRIRVPLLTKQERYTYHSVNLDSDLPVSLHGLPAEYQITPFIFPTEPESAPVTTSKHYSNSTLPTSATLSYLIFTLTSPVPESRAHKQCYTVSGSVNVARVNTRSVGGLVIQQFRRVLANVSS
jgi:hypothetical protein